MTGINFALNLSVERQIPARGPPETPRQGHGARDHRHRGGDCHSRVVPRKLISAAKKLTTGNVVKVPGSKPGQVSESFYCLS